MNTPTEFAKLVENEPLNFSPGTDEGAAALQAMKQPQQSKQTQKVSGLFLYNGDGLVSCEVVSFDGGTYFRTVDSWQPGDWMPLAPKDCKTISAHLIG